MTDMNRRSALEKIVKSMFVVAAAPALAACADHNEGEYEHKRLLYNDNLDFGDGIKRHVKYFDGGAFKPDEIFIYEGEKKSTGIDSEPAIRIVDGHDNNKIGTSRRDKVVVFLQDKFSDSERVYRKHRFVNENGAVYRKNDDVGRAVVEATQKKLKAAEQLYNGLKKVIANELGIQYGPNPSDPTHSTLNQLYETVRDKVI
jgi:hypothetical protein